MKRLPKKLHNRLKYLEPFCNGGYGMYPGDHWDLFGKQYWALSERGYVSLYQPHNPAHRERAVITEAGRTYLKEHA